MTTIYVVMQCFGYEPGAVRCIAAYTSTQEAEAAKIEAEAQNDPDDNDAGDSSFWVEEVDLK